MTYVPQDFRGTIIRQQKERSERNRQAYIDALVSSGGSIHDKYALLWKQQMDRRKQLAELGSATGVYKTMMKYLVGVPEVLMDFVRQINDDQGPMEEQRQRYGPPLYSLTRMVYSICLFLTLLWGGLETQKLQKDQISDLEEAANVYTSELERFIKFIGNLNHKNLQMIASSAVLATLSVPPYDRSYGVSHLELGNDKERSFRVANLIAFDVESKPENRRTGKCFPGPRCSWIWSPKVS